MAHTQYKHTIILTSNVSPAHSDFICITCTLHTQWTNHFLLFVLHFIPTQHLGPTFFTKSLTPATLGGGDFIAQYVNHSACCILSQVNLFYYQLPSLLQGGVHFKWISQIAHSLVAFQVNIYSTIITIILAVNTQTPIPTMPHFPYASHSHAEFPSSPRAVSWTIFA